MKKNLFFFFFVAFTFLGVYAQTSGTVGNWDLRGNSLTDSRNFIGTTDRNPLIFKTGDLERMRLLPTQSFLGIGTTNPLATLHLHYPAGMDITQNLLQLTTGTAGNGFSIISNRNTNDLYFRQQESAKFFLEGPGGGLAIAQDGKVGFGTDAPKEKLHISNGNLLISGQSSGIFDTPACALIFSDVIDNSYPFGRWGIEYCSSSGFNGLMFRKYGGTEGSNEVGDQQVLLLSNSGDAILNGKLSIGASTPLTNLQIGNFWTFQDRKNSSTMGRNTYFNGTDDVRIYAGTASRISFNDLGDILLQTASSDAANTTIRWNTVTVAANGDMGIGTIATPKAKLEVNGSFRANDTHINGFLCAKEVHVRLSGAPCWPDYVFSKNYNLMPLQELEQFVNENQHLPNIPSAAEVEENGIELGEMNAKLLKKVEELTLYLLQQEKKMLELQKQIDELKTTKP